MIFSYKELAKKSFLKRYKKYNKINYENYYYSGINYIKPKVIEFADTINENFIDSIFCNNDIEFIFYSTDTTFSLKYCKGIIIYTKSYNSITKEENIYLLLICVDRHYRKFGYGKVFLEEFIDYMKETNNKNKKIILHSLDKSINFYKNIGFTDIEDSPNKYKKLFKYEKYDKNINLLELKI